jgi:uncharacterized protein
MRKIKAIFLSIGFVLVLVAAWAYAGPQDMPRPRGFVSDTAGVLPATERIRLESFLASVEKRTSAEVAVVTIASLDGETIESFAVELFEHWGIGKKGKDNGVLLLVSMGERKMRIEVGYGLEGALPDGLTGSILDRHIVPQFKRGAFADGIRFGTYAIAAEIGKEYNVDLFSAQGIDGNEYLESASSGPNELMQLLFSLFFFIFIIFGRGFFWPLFFGFPMGGRYWSGGGAYRGGGSFSSGGFGGFGGGFSGGGGASRGW